MLSFLDFPHIGTLSGHIRQRRIETLTSIAQFCGVDVSTISRIELNGKPRRKNFKCYVTALQSSELVMKNLRLSSQQAKILRELYDHNEEKEEREKELEYIDLEQLKLGHLSGKRIELLTELMNETRPAFIMDSLWFIHAINGALLRLFDVSPNSPYLSNWEAWHVIATKFHQASKIRTSHYDSDAYFSPTVMAFFTYKDTYPFFFTRQMRMLIRRMCELSDENQLKFAKWWGRATAFALDFELKNMTRTIWYNEQRIQTEALIRMNQEVEVMPEHEVLFTLSVWDPIGSDAEQAFAKIRSYPDSQNIYYATDYDKNKDFHANNWPEEEFAAL